MKKIESRKRGIIYELNIALRVKKLIKSNDEYLWAKPVATGLLVIRLSRPFAAKSAANWVMKSGVSTWR